jgi:leader peptidase (prepilin peptidase)/N-methyltransferase
MLLDESTLEIFLAAFLFCLGACIGSFLNVVAYRLPLNISIVTPPSHCTHCSAPVPAIGLVPILGWFFVRGRCASCGTKVSWLYPAVELLCAVGTVFLFQQTLSAQQLVGALWPDVAFGTQVGEMRFQPLVQFLTRLFLFYTAIPLTIIDLRYRILPDVITLGGTPVALFLGGASVALGWKGALLGALVGSGLLYFVAKTYEVLRGREGLGMGDVKYMALIGAVVGWQGVLIVLGLASILGSLVGIAIGLRRRVGLQTVLPFGPFLAVAALVVCLWQPLILQFFFEAP